MKPILLVVLSLTILSCNFFKKEEQEDTVARVGDTYLYASDISEMLPDNINKQDSLLFVNAYINNWATKQILKQKATLNLNQEKQSEFNRLAEEYKLDLYTNYYLDALITKQLDTTITKAQLDSTYKFSKQNFKLNENLVKFRYVILNKESDNITRVRGYLERFNNKDKIVLDSLSIQFDSYMLNDSLWIKQSQLYKKMPLLGKQENSQLLKKSNFIQLEDSLQLYLIQIKDLLLREEIAPKEYVKPTLEQIILNKRKLNKIKELEIDIRKDALQNKEFEVYN